MRKLFGFIFNRWVALVLLFAALMALLWIVGPMVSVGAWRPLETSRSLWIATAVIVGVA